VEEVKPGVGDVRDHQKRRYGSHEEYKKGEPIGGGKAFTKKKPRLNENSEFEVEKGGVGLSEGGGTNNNVPLRNRKEGEILYLEEQRKSYPRGDQNK